MLVAVTVTVILTTVGWPVSALMSKFVNEIWEKTRKHLSKKKSEIQSLKADQKNSVEDRRPWSTDKKKSEIQSLKVEQKNSVEDRRPRSTDKKKSEIQNLKAEQKNSVEDRRPRLTDKKKSEIQSLETEQKNSVEDQRPRSMDKKNELHELKELRREVLIAADLLTNQLEPFLHRVELMIANCAEHGTIDETCPARSKTPEQITKKSAPETKSSNEVCRVCSALERIRTKLVSGLVLDMVLDMATKVKEIIESSVDEGPHKVHQREPALPNSALAVTELEPKPKPQPLESTGQEIGCRPQFSEAVRNSSELGLKNHSFLNIVIEDHSN